MIVHPTTHMTVRPSPAAKWEESSKSKLRSAMKGGQKRACPSQPSMTRFVTFDQSVDVHEVPHLRNLPPEEVSAKWYNNEDFERIKKALVTTLRLMMANKPIGQDQCIRGLEFRTPQGAKQRKKNKLEALTAVWNEQVSQWKDNVIDDEAIRKVYLEQSLKCRESARKFGIQDEKAVQKYLEADRDSEGSFSSMDTEKTTSSRPQKASQSIDTLVVKQTCTPSAA